MREEQHGGAEMNLKEYAKTQTFTEGFQQGDTHLALEELDFEDYKFKDDTGKELVKTKIKTKDRKEYYCPRSVFREIVHIAEAGGKEVRITRTGTTRDNTKYTVVKTK